MSAERAAPILSGGMGSRVSTEDGRNLVDLAMGFGAAFLGHAHPVVNATLQQHAASFWSSGRQPTRTRERVEAMLAALLPAGMRVGGLYTTGMEVAEFAMRVAATHTGRAEFAGFSKSMHGKSAMTAALCWSNATLRPGNLHTLAFVDEAGETSILEDLEQLLGSRRIAALFIEPMQGSNGAHEASIDFYERAIGLCRAHGTLCVFDEILTGLHRTGPRFYANRLRVTPDVILFAKSMGNGFPVSTLALAEGIEIRQAATPGSTFSGNPLALAAIEGTLSAMSRLDLPRLVAAIESTVRAELAGLQAAGAKLRGRGALWCIELDPRASMGEVLARISDSGLLVSAAGRCVRLLPAATIEPPLLKEACEKIARACAC